MNTFSEDESSYKSASKRKMAVLNKIHKDKAQKKKGEIEEKKPQIHFFLYVPKKFLKISITLHKIPHKFINFEPFEDHFIIDTLKFTGKFYYKYVPLTTNMFVSKVESNS